MTCKHPPPLCLPSSALEKETRGDSASNCCDIGLIEGNLPIGLDSANKITSIPSTCQQLQEDDAFCRCVWNMSHRYEGMHPGVGNGTFSWAGLCWRKSLVDLRERQAGAMAARPPHPTQEGRTCSSVPSSSGQRGMLHFPPGFALCCEEFMPSPTGKGYSHSPRQLGSFLDLFPAHP